MKFTFARLLGAFEFLLLCKKVVLLASSLFRAISFPGEIPYFPFPERLFITSIGTQETIYGDFKARQGLNASETKSNCCISASLDLWKRQKLSGGVKT